MCGIFGHLGTLSQDSSRRLIQEQTKRLHHRGPDGFGLHVDDELAFGHVRLSIIDPDGGTQPMLSFDKRYIITFNGEIYNYLELRKKLELQGVSFLTRSDTEVLLVSYLCWGPQCLEHLNGMFAFAIYDKLRKKLFCARDPMGQKPFYYFENSQGFYFASEVSALTCIPEFNKRMDLKALECYLSFEAFHQEYSIYEGIKKLPPGHALEVALGEPSKTFRYFKSLPQQTRVSLDTSKKTLNDTLHKAIERSFRADVPVGVLLSGGLDSSLVLSILRKIKPDDEITSFHIRVDDKTYEEYEYAKEVARIARSELVVCDLNLKNLAELAKYVPTQFDEPQADPGILPKFRVCQEIRKNMKVALGGDGGDELFYGYLPFKAHWIGGYYNQIPDVLHSGLIKPLVELLPSQSGYMRLDFLAKNFLKGFPSETAVRNHLWTASFSATELDKLLLHKRQIPDWGDSYLYALYNESENSGYLGKLAYQYQQTYLPNYILNNSDRAAMLNSVELRSPLLDSELIHAANRIPDKFKLRRGCTKWILKEIGLRYLPRHLIYRKKMGFTVPIADLLRTELKSDLEATLSEKELKKQGLLNYSYVRQLLDAHYSKKYNFYKKIWTLYSFHKWLAHQ